jgi:hypothetical protein
MIEISTYLKRGEDFIPLEKFACPLPDEDYVEGAIELSIDGRSLLTRAEWDCIDQLWAYLVDGLVSLQDGKPFKTYFPDQPIEMAFTPDARSGRVMVQVTINRNRVDVSTSLPVFITELARAARRFFEQMQGLLPKATYAQILCEISRLEKTQASRTANSKSS